MDTSFGLQFVMEKWTADHVTALIRRLAFSLGRVLIRWRHLSHNHPLRKHPDARQVAAAFQP
jgi:hypothetical protein